MHFFHNNNYFHLPLKGALTIFSGLQDKSLLPCPTGNSCSTPSIARHAWRRGGVKWLECCQWGWQLSANGLCPIDNVLKWYLLSSHCSLSPIPQCCSLILSWLTQSSNHIHGPILAFLSFWTLLRTSQQIGDVIITEFTPLRSHWSDLDEPPRSHHHFQPLPLDSAPPIPLET